MRPTIPITGVGYTAPRGFSLYSETLPPVTGVSERAARFAPCRGRPRGTGSTPPAGADCRSSDQFVIAIGRAPVHATLRAASPTAICAADARLEIHVATVAVGLQRRARDRVPRNANAPRRRRPARSRCSCAPIVSYCRWTHVFARDRRRRRAIRWSVQAGVASPRALGDRVDVARRAARRSSGSSHASGGVHRTIGHEARCRELGDDAIAFGHAIHRLGDDLADHRGREVPFREDLLDLRLASASARRRAFAPATR